MTACLTSERAAIFFAHAAKNALRDGKSEERALRSVTERRRLNLVPLNRALEALPFDADVERLLANRTELFRKWERGELCVIDFPEQGT